MGLAIGQIIGSGIMVLTGIVIGLTGHGIAAAFILGAVLAIITCVPFIILTSAIPSSGAGFTYIRRLMGEKAGFMYIAMFVLSQVLIATYAKGFASYFCSIFPQFGESAVAMAALVICTAVNLIGLKSSALVQKGMVVLLLLSLFLFIVFGLPKVSWDALTPTVSNLMPNGPKNFFTGVALLSFACGGAKFVAENGDDIVEPSRTIPKVIVLSTSIVAVFYVLIGIVAGGVLPVETVAFQNLTLVAQEIFPTWLYLFFVFGGAVFALLTTLNGTLSWVTRGLQAAAKQGWLPEKTAEENRNGVPAILLMVFFLMGAIPILTGMDLTLIFQHGCRNRYGDGIYGTPGLLASAGYLPGRVSEICVLYEKADTSHSAVFHRHSDDRNLVCQSVGSYRSSGDRMRHLYSGDVCLHAGPIPVCERQNRKRKKTNKEEKWRRNMRATTKEQGFYSQIFKLVLPIVIQNLLSAAVNSADVVMLNYVGQSAISAVSLASNYANVLFMVYYGLGTGATLLCAQYFGKGNMRAIQTVEGIALRFSVIISVVVAGIAFTMPQMMMRLFTDNVELIRIGASYLRVMGVTYLCWGITEIYLAVLRSLGRVTISMAMNMMAFALNVFFNACFIFGLFGFPKLGATGVAIATAMSRVIELIGCVIVSIMSKDIKLDLRYMFIRNKLLFSDFVKLSLPALGNDLSWGVAFSMYSVILGHLGSDAVAANSLVVVVRNIGTVLCFGVASAGGILLGNVMGEGNLEKAKEYASKLLKLTVVAGAVGGLVVLGITPFVLKFASLNETAMHYLKYMLLINTYYIMGAAVNTTLIAGVFRAGGDTKFGLVCDTIDMWCYAVPLGFIAAFVFKLPVLVVYFLLCTDEFVKWPWVLKRYKSGLWAKNITRDHLFEDEEKE